MSEKILLIDGHSIMNRAFYGLPPLTNSEGLHTNAVLGFLNILFKVLDEECPQYLAVAFDLHAPTFRHRMYSGYKGTRRPMPDELRQQIPVIRQVLTAMGVPLMSLEGYEADDMIGTASLQMEQKGLEVRILSGDRDLLQLASERTEVCIPKTKKSGTEIEYYYAADVKEKYLVTPEEFVHVKALMGDASDNIPGIPGVGEKTAAKIIARFHTIGNAHDHLDEVTPNKARLSLQDHYEQAKLSYDLALINRHVPFELSLEEAALGEGFCRIYTKEALDLLRKLQLRQMTEKFAGRMAQQDGQEGENEADSAQRVEASYRMIGDREAGAAFLRDVTDEVRSRSTAEGKAARAGIEVLIEDGQMLGAAVSSDAGTALLTGIGPEELAEFVGRVCDEGGLICGIDMKEQLCVMDRGDAFSEEEQAHFFDCAVGAYLLSPNDGSYPPDIISSGYAGKLMKTRAELLGKRSLREVLFLATGDLRYMPEDRKSAAKAGGPGDPASAGKAILQYACGCAETALSAQQEIERHLKEEGMWKLFTDIEMPMMFTLYHMQQEGILVRGDELKAFGQNLTGKIAELEEDIYHLAGQRFNINSPKQLGTVLFEDLHMPGGKKTKTGYSTAADVLDNLAPDYPIVSMILEYRQLTKLKSTYADGLYPYIQADGRIHGKFNQTVAATGRISSTEPNLQNIPVRTELGAQLRKVFVPKEGSIFVDADYSQIELRVLAHISDDENLIEAYNSAEDIHAITASKVFHVPLEEVTPQLRRNAKAVNFGIVYGISSFGLTQRLSISRKEAQDYISQYFETYPGVKAWLDGAVASARKNGWSVTMYGRRRPIPELKDSNFMRRQFGERVAMNAPIQGSAADIIKIAMVRVDRRLRSEGMRSRLVLQIHDELLIEAAEQEAEEVEKILREEMEGAASLRVRLEIDMHTGKSWFEAH